MSNHEDFRTMLRTYYTSQCSPSRHGQLTGRRGDAVQYIVINPRYVMITAPVVIDQPQELEAAPMIPAPVISRPRRMADTSAGLPTSRPITNKTKCQQLQPAPVEVDEIANFFIQAQRNQMEVKTK